ncbi:nucleoside diphosphate kinase [Paraphysoderma sedebokerense]|nr:nucleoside diphosphate kinase [Paraphysoderma sedebokerense]
MAIPPHLHSLTLALIKPDLYANPILFNRVLSSVNSNFNLLSIKHPIQWSAADAERFYAEHGGKFFFQRLTSYMSSGPFCAMILQRHNDKAIKKWREVIGITQPVRARIHQPHSLRALYGLTDTRNSFHGSDSPETAKREIQFFFPDFDYEKFVNT